MLVRGGRKRAKSINGENSDRKTKQNDYKTWKL